MAIKEGTAAIYGENGSISSNNAIGESIFPARVYFTLLNRNVNKESEMQVNPGSIGAIQCRRIYNGQIDEVSPFLVAYPLDTNIKKFPIENEVVLILPNQSTTAIDGTGNNNLTYYYITIVNIWDSVEHNAIPDVSFFKTGKSPELSDYIKSQTGIQKSINTGNIKNVTGKNFTETGKIKKLYNSPGDIIIEGRFGNAIRIGSSNTFFSDLPWKGENSKPIIIISNNQRETTGDSWNPIFEDINGDGSFMGIFSSQTIDFIPSSLNFNSYNKKIKIEEKNNIVQKKEPTQVIDNRSLNQTDRLQNIVDIPSKTYKISGSFDEVIQEDEINFIPDREDQFEFTQELSNTVPLTNGTILSPKFNSVFGKKYDGGETSTSTKNKLTKSSVFSGNVNQKINLFAGKVSQVSDISRQGKALLDLISLCEGTLGAGKFNGYDITFNYNLIPGYITENAEPPHPNNLISVNGFSSTAAGRYQFLYTTWVEEGSKYGIKTMSKKNQDLLAWNRIKFYRNIKVTDINKIDVDFDIFKRIIGGDNNPNTRSKLSLDYASLPDSIKGNDGFYGQGGKYDMNSLYIYYKQILNKY